jgi:hypothetical protein
MKISASPLMQTFSLESDPEGVAQVTIRQAREGENIERSELFARTQRVFDDTLVGTIRLETEYNQLRLRRKEAYLTLASITGIQDAETGDEWFRSGETVDGASIRAVMSEAEFNRKWGLLPPDMVREIVRLVHRVNPTWNPERLGESISG